MTGDERGATVVELLIAAAMTATLAAAVLAMLDPVQGMHQAQPEAADVQQRLRVVVDSLRRSLVAAGAGTSMPGVSGPLTGVLAPVMPYRGGESGGDAVRGVFHRPDAITVVHTPVAAAQARVLDAAPIGPSDLHVNPAPCGVPAPCGFTAGMRTLVFDPSGAWDLMTVARTSGPALQLEHRRGRPPHTYAGDAAIVQIEIDTFYLHVDARAGVYQLRHDNGFGVDLPLVDDVVDLSFEYFGEPEPPRVLAGADLSSAGFGRPATTYGPRPPPAGLDRALDAWPPGENCVFAFAGGSHAPRLARLPGAGPPVPLPPAMFEDGPWCPDAASADRFDADLLRIRRIRVRVRVQAGGLMSRGSAGPFFTRGGRALSANRLVPDLEVAFDVAPRNLGAGR